MYVVASLTPGDLLLRAWASQSSGWLPKGRGKRWWWKLGDRGDTLMCYHVIASQQTLRVKQGWRPGCVTVHLHKSPNPFFCTAE